MDGIQRWANMEFQDRSVEDLSMVFSNVKSIVKFEKRSESTKPRPKHKGNGAGDKEKPDKPQQSKFLNLGERNNDYLKCYTCGGNHYQRTYPQWEKFVSLSQGQLLERIKDGLSHDPKAKMLIDLAKDGMTRWLWLDVACSMLDYIASMCFILGRRRGLCEDLPYVPIGRDRVEETKEIVAAITHSRATMVKCFLGFHSKTCTLIVGARKAASVPELRRLQRKGVKYECIKWKDSDGNGIDEDDVIL
ncbi:hypothetical protein GQ457_17G007770 [Hibiscus cannabinus]